VEPLRPAEISLGPIGSLGAVRLRPWRDDDLPAVLGAFSDPDLIRWTTHEAHPDEGLVRAWLLSRRDGWNSGEMATWAAVTAPAAIATPAAASSRDGGGPLLGSVGLKRLRWARLAAAPVHTDVMYWVLPAARGSGLASALASSATTWAHGVLGLHRVELHHELDNAGSCRVARRAGYELEGTTRRSFSTPRGWVDEHLHAWVAPDHLR
jgi:ribosomal-protein-alanine N-acetyltransferase